MSKTCAICGQKLSFNNQGYSVGKEKICSDDNNYLIKALGYKLPLGIKDTVKVELDKGRLPFKEAKNLIEQQKLKDSIEHQKTLNQLRQQSEIVKKEAVVTPAPKNVGPISEPEPEPEAVDNANQELKSENNTSSSQTDETANVTEQSVQEEKISKLEKAVKVTSMIGSVINSMRQPHCPKCRSTNVQAVGQHRKGFSVGKAVAGTALSGGLGAIAGFAGKNTKKVDMICMNCGKKFRF